MTVIARGLVAGLACVTLIAGCGDGYGTDPDSPVAGTWVATQFRITPTGQAQIDALAAGGTLTITIATNNSTSGTISLPASVTGGAALNASMAGTASLNGANTEVTFTQAADTFVRDLTWQRVGNTSLSVSNQTAGSASFTITLTKQ